eukprot:CAMPEP_0176308288 /NCGR_PEP_ID=MMETSP0121_2-20121125/64466_1 /TAXON_ID=160619 /ORGANISM="Kryptoperidinium foliaceum, Strain CCMP 1326" /LENGTH=91 /DNA_ID=CAMNT_0017650115 /DNA_START=22 /DNA_END=296 /DNA_ORIENTATION=-
MMFDFPSVSALTDFFVQRAEEDRGPTVLVESSDACGEGQSPNGKPSSLRAHEDERAQELAMSRKGWLCAAWRQLARTASHQGERGPSSISV